MNVELAIFEAAREAFRLLPRPEEVEVFKHVLSGYGFVIREKTVTETMVGGANGGED